MQYRESFLIWLGKLPSTQRLLLLSFALMILSNAFTPLYAGEVVKDCIELSEGDSENEPEDTEENEESEADDFVHVLKDKGLASEQTLHLEKSYHTFQKGLCLDINTPPPRQAFC